MNLMEIGKKPEMKQKETVEQPKNSETVTEKLTQLSQMTEESLIKLKVERDLLIQSFEKAKAFMRTQKQQIQMLEEEKQTILSDRQRLQEEVRKSNVEIQCLTTELLETQKLNQLLQQSNDDLRNRNGLKSRKEQEQLEEEIKDVRDQNCKLEELVEMSSVEAVRLAQEKQEAAEVAKNSAETQVMMIKKNTTEEVKRIRKQAEREIKNSKERERFWQIYFGIAFALLIIITLYICF